MTEPLFLAGVFTGLFTAACIAGLYGLVLKLASGPRTPIDWDERAYLPHVVTTIETPNRRRKIEL